MHSYYGRFMRITAILTLLAVSGAGHFALAGVSRAIQEKYRRSYEGKALFLRTPVFAERKYVDLSGGSFRFEPDPTGTARFKVGEQVRITGMDFGGEEIRFRISAIAGGNIAEVIFRFDASLKEDFPNSDVVRSGPPGDFHRGPQVCGHRGCQEGLYRRCLRTLHPRDHDADEFQPGGSAEERGRPSSCLPGRPPGTSTR